MMPYEVDTGSDGNIMPFLIYKKLFLRSSGSKKDAKSSKKHVTVQQ